MASGEPITALCVISAKGIGGQCVRATDVYQRLSDRGFEPLIGVYASVPSLIEYVEKRGFDPVILKARPFSDPRRVGEFLAYCLTAPLAIVRLWRLFRRRKIDLVHINGAYDIMPALAARLAGAKVVWHLNDTAIPRRFAPMGGALVRLLADEVVVAASRVGEHYGIRPEVRQVLFAPVDTDRFAAREPIPQPSQEPLIGMTGNWNWIKGQERFVDLIARLRAAGTKAKGKIVGGLIPSQEKFWKPILADMRESDLDSEIEVVGYSDDVPAAVRSLDVLVLTSRSEACPICVLEAMSTGVPVVAFDVGGTAEMLEDGEGACGFVVPEGDVAAMQRKVELLIADPALYRSMAQNGQARARDVFSIGACVDRHEEIYRKAMAVS